MPAKELLSAFKTNPKVPIVAAAAVLALALLLVPSGTESQERSREGDEASYPFTYEKELEAKLSSLISSIEGVGEAVVMVTLEAGEEQVYAHETNDKTYESGRETENSLTIIETDDGDEAIVLKQIQPVIKGVAIVCEGGNNITVKENVISAVATVLGLPSNRVSVSAMG